MTANLCLWARRVGESERAYRHRAGLLLLRASSASQQSVRGFALDSITPRAIGQRKPTEFQERLEAKSCEYGERGIRTLGRTYARHTISSRARSTAPAPLLARFAECEG